MIRRARGGGGFAQGDTMNDTCPVCGHHFEREPVYFLGAMYISYPLSLVVIGLCL